jgi:hypothetical protein
MRKFPLAGLLAALPLGLTLACSGGTPPTNVAPTAQAVANQAAPTMQAAAPTVQAAVQQAVPTIQAAATAAAPTVQAVATQAARQAAPIVATVDAGAPVRIVDARMTPGDATLTLQNATTQMVDLTGWVLDVGGTSLRLPANTQVGPGMSVTIHTGPGTSSGSNVYLGQEGQKLADALKPGVRVALTNPAGAPVTAFTVPTG